MLTRSTTLTTLNVDGAGNIRLDVAGVGAAPTLKVVDATNLKGVFFYDGDSVTQAGITVKAGSGGSNIGTDGNSAERITFMRPKQSATVDARAVQQRWQFSLPARLLPAVSSMQGRFGSPISRLGVSIKST